MTDTRHIFTPFEESLNRLRDDVLMMATLTLRALGTRPAADQQTHAFWLHFARA